MLPSRSPLQSFAVALLLASGVLIGASGSFDAPIHGQEAAAEPEANSGSFQGQMSHSLGRTSRVSVSTGTSINASAEASMSPGYDAISISRVDLSPHAFDPSTGILDSSLPQQVSRVKHNISSGTGVTSNTLSSSSLAAKSTSQDWINQARSSANEAVGASFYDYLTGVVNEGDTPNPEITDEASWQEQWNSNYNTAYSNVLDGAADQDKKAVDYYMEEEQSTATGTVTTTGVSAETSVALSEGTGFSTVITPKGYAYDNEASLAKGAPVYSCQSKSCEYQTPVLSQDGLLAKINDSHMAAKEKADADIEDRVTELYPGYVAGKEQPAMVNERLEEAVPVLYIRDDSSGQPVYTPTASFLRGQDEKVYKLNSSNQYVEYELGAKDFIYRLGEDGGYTLVDEVAPGGSYVKYNTDDYAKAKAAYEGSSLMTGWSDEERGQEVSAAYGEQHELGRIYPRIRVSRFESESHYGEYRDDYYARANRLNYDNAYDSEYRQQVNSWLTQDERILSDRQSGSGNAGVGVSTNMNVSTSNDSFQQAFIQAFN